MEMDKKIKEDLKTVALGTSKINYLDPRITVAWCKRHEVPIEKVQYWDNIFFSNFPIDNVLYTVTENCSEYCFLLTDFQQNASCEIRMGNGC